MGWVDREYTVTNNGGSDLAVSDIVVGGDAYLKTSFAVPPVVPPGGSQAFVVALDVMYAGPKVANVSIASDAADSPFTFTITWWVKRDKKRKRRRSAGWHYAFR